MKRFMICNQPDEDIFNKQCRALEEKIPELIKKDTLNDVEDGSMTQRYVLGEEIIYVHNSYYIGEVYIETNIDLFSLFE